MRDSLKLENVKARANSNLFRHIYYVFGFYFFHSLIYLVILSILAFFHFLLDHRLADIQDWIFFNSWWILIFSKIISFFIISRFTGILSFERRPLIHLIEYSRGILRSEVFVAISVTLMGITLLGHPSLTNHFEWEVSKIFASYLGMVLLMGLDALLLLTLNQNLPISRRAWNAEIFFFAVICFFFNKLTYFYGLSWNIHMIFFYLLAFFTLKLRGQFVWLHSFLMITLLIAPLASLFGLDPLWNGLYAPFTFSKQVAGLEIGVFTLLALFYFQSKRFKKIPL